MTHRVKVLQKGKLTLPQEVREQLGIREGDELLLEAEAGRIVIRSEKMSPNPTLAMGGLAAGLRLSKRPKRELARATAGILHRKLEGRA